MIKCMRCQKEIPKANSQNASYIINVSDVRTHGPRKKTSFDVFNEGFLVATETKLEKAKVHLDKDISKADKKIKDKKKEVDSAFEAMDLVENTPTNKPLKEAKIAALKIKHDEYSEVVNKKNTIKISSRIEIVNVPKTGMICKDPKCQDANDKKIW